RPSPGARSARRWRWHFHCIADHGSSTLEDLPMTLIPWLRSTTKRSKTIKHECLRAARRRSASHRPSLEALEDRTLLSVSLTNVPKWVDQGPGPIGGVLNLFPKDINDKGIQDEVGAVESIAVAPVKALDNSTHYIVYAGTVNGGIWRAGFVDPITKNW